MAFLRKKVKLEKPLPLTLATQDGRLVETYPGNVVDTLRHMISRLVRAEPFPQRLAFVASLRQEGVSYIARALATTLANDMEATICVVELNWWWPSAMPQSNGTPNGLASVLQGDMPLDEATMRTNMPNMDILPPGMLTQEERTGVARSSLLRETIDELNHRYRHLILDIPAILATSDAIPLATLGTDCCVLIRQGVTSIENACIALDDIDHLKIAGVIMNQVELATPSFLLRYIPQK
ncbi:MAG: CpsD/CapB family tyrosine-protein kinase [Chloroflexi bacterium]|nr:CpsD/CapB family tyrosine-protein kinase [Chloroflexota bacterium]